MPLPAALFVLLPLLRLLLSPRSPRFARRLPGRRGGAWVLGVCASVCAVGAMAASTPTTSLMPPTQLDSAPLSTAATTVKSAQAATLWPRLFYTPAQRLALVRSRQADTEPAPPGTPAATDSGPLLPPTPPSFVLQGLTQGRLGASAWVNGLVLRDGDTLAGRTVHIGQGAVHLHQAGQPDLVLRPGQASEAPDQPVVDVVPAGSFKKK